jgi:hypothetical protein
VNIQVTAINLFFLFHGKKPNVLLACHSDSYLRHAKHLDQLEVLRVESNFPDPPTDPRTFDEEETDLIVNVKQKYDHLVHDKLPVCDGRDACFPIGA